ncbi:hypothetical protein D9M69_558340 [compost metagenome]
MGPVYQRQSARVAHAAAGGEDPVPIDEQALVIEPAFAPVHAANGNLDPPFAQRLIQVVERHDGEFHLDVRCLFPQGRQRHRDVAGGVGDDVLDHANGQGSRQHAADRVDLGANAFQRLQRVARQFQRNLARLGQLETGRPAVAQPHAQRFLDLAHMPADGRLGHVQLLFRRGEAVGLRHGAEDAQRAQVAFGELGTGQDRFFLKGIGF